MMGRLHMGTPASREDIARVADLARAGREGLGFPEPSDVLAGPGPTQSGRTTWSSFGMPTGGHQEGGSGSGLRGPQDTQPGGSGHAWGTQSGGTTWRPFPPTQQGASTGSAWGTQLGGPTWSSYAGPPAFVVPPPTQQGASGWAAHAVPPPTQPGGSGWGAYAGRAPTQQGGSSWQSSGQVLPAPPAAPAWCTQQLQVPFAPAAGTSTDFLVS